MCIHHWMITVEKGKPVGRCKICREEKVFKPRLRPGLSKQDLREWKERQCEYDPAEERLSSWPDKLEGILMGKRMSPLDDSCPLEFVGGLSGNGKWDNTIKTYENSR